jgi:pilus assembly protein Flp/PilA
LAYPTRTVGYQKKIGSFDSIPLKVDCPAHLPPGLFRLISSQMGHTGKLGRDHRTSSPLPPFTLLGVKFMSQCIAAVRRFLNREDGATMVEYGLMVALIAVVAVAAVGTLGTTVTGIFGTVNSGFTQ